MSGMSVGRCRLPLPRSLPPNSESGTDEPCPPGIASRRSGGCPPLSAYGVAPSSHSATPAVCSPAPGGRSHLVSATAPNRALRTSWAVPSVPRSTSLSLPMGSGIAPPDGRPAASRASCPRSVSLIAPNLAARTSWQNGSTSQKHSVLNPAHCPARLKPPIPAKRSIIVNSLIFFIPKNNLPTPHHRNRAMPYHDSSPGKLIFTST